MSLFFRDQTLPQSWLDAVCKKCSTHDLLVRMDGLSFGFRHGLNLIGVRVYDRTRQNVFEPMASVQKVSIDFLRRRVVLVRAKYVRLSDSYYQVGDYQETHREIDVTLPRLPDFHLILDYPEILGLKPHRVTAKVEVTSKRLLIDDIHIDWPNETHAMKIDGLFFLDFVSRSLHGEARGESVQAHIRPLLEALDVPVSFPYFDAFTEITQPIQADGTFDADLTNNDFRMRLWLEPILGRYNGVKMDRAKGLLDLYVYTRDRYLNTDLTVQLPYAFDPEGKKLSGELKVHSTNDLTRLSFDVTSELALEDALAIADFMERETIDVLQCETKPFVTVKGHSGISAADADYNNLAFYAKLARGSFLGFQLRDVETDFAIQGERLNFTKLDAHGKMGGRYQGDAYLSFPGYEGTNITFGVRLTCTDGRLKELADFSNYETGAHDGKVDGHLTLTGRVSSEQADYSSFNGSGSIRITEGYLAQMKLFAGLTELLADKVPGVGFLVNQSQASADYTIKDGIFYSDNIFIEGEVFSLKAWGSYDMIRDEMDFTVRIQFMKKESWLGKVVHPVTWPFTKLLLEFKAKGSLADPTWEYISILDRIL